MKMKGGKAGKKTKQRVRRKGSVSSDDEQFSVSTSLPPAVEGQLRCFVSLSVSKLTWSVDKHPIDVQIRICWWGEQGQGTVLCPLRQQNTSIGIDSTTKWNSVRYPVCSGPKQFAAYLNDMGTLLLEAVHSSTQIPFGKALIYEITKLTASHPVNVTVPIMSVISPFNKLADVQVFIKFESVSAAYNKLSSSIPTIDTGLDKENVDISNPQPTPPPYFNPATPVSHPRHIKGLDDPFESPAPKKGVKFSENPPEKLEYMIEPSLLSLLANDQSDTSGKQLQDDNLFKTDNKTDAPVTGSDGKPVDTARDKELSGQILNPEISTDWIGALLERGQRLRDGLAMSTLLDDNSSGSFIEHFNSPQRHVPPGRLLKEILHKEDSSYIFDSVPKRVTTSPGRVPAIDVEDKVIDLLMGEQHDFIDNMSTLSDVSQEQSETGDPVYDDSLLMDLFYKSQESKSCEEDTISTEGEFDSSTLTNGSLEEDLEGKRNPPKQSSPKHHMKKIRSHHKKSKIKKLMAENDDNESTAEHPMELSDEQAVSSITSTDSFCKDDLVIEQLGIDILTTLGRVNTARVVIDRLELIDSEVNGGVNDGEAKKPRTYFVEYSFPIIATKEGDKHTMASEITRVASKRTQEKAVLFNHRSVFPVLFNASVVEHWFKAGMQFKIFMRDSGQRQPTEVGVGTFKLKSVLVSSDLSHEAKVDIKEHERHYDTDKTSLQSFETSNSPSSAKSQENAIFGKLEVKIELGVDGKTVSVTPLPASQPNIPSTTTTVSMVSRPVVISCSQSQPHQHKPGRLSSKPPLPHTSSKQVETTDLLTLHSLLWIQEGKNITVQPHGSHNNQVPGISARTNLFLVSRMFWCEEVSKSPVCWGASHPQFGFKQVAPVLLSPTLLERTCNNFMVVEVWDKLIPQGEKLVGIVKLPLHQLYLSYRDPKITKTLLKSKFPVVCVDDMLPVSSPFTGTCHGELKALLAIGTEEQISSLLNVKDGNDAADAQTLNIVNRPLHHLDKQRQPNVNNSNSPPKKTAAIDHHFEITVGDIRGLSIFNSTVWGETDCYVQYLFPQQHRSGEYVDVEVVPGLKSHHTPTTLCVPDPSFQDVTRHSFVLPPGVPVQRYLLAAYSGSWTSGQLSVPGSGGVPFELWRRYYYPNVRDQLVAKASLPVAKLCAMVTMQRHREPSVQSLSLPLMVLPDNKNGTKQDSGLLEITVKYHATKIQPDDQTKTIHDQVHLSLDIIRACGLKDSAMAQVKSNPSMSYPADVGINAYVVIKLPIGCKKKYVTRTVARTFAPDFSHHIDIAAPLKMRKNTQDDLDQRLISLAEKLEMTEAVFELWHQHSRGVGNIGSHSEHHRENDVPLGVVTIPLSELLICRTGISGWYAVKPFDTNSSINHDSVIGGLQLSIKFEDPEDREAVMHAGRSLGWSPPPGIEYDDDDQLFDLGDDDDDDNDFPKGLELVIKIRRAWVPALFQEYPCNVKSIKGYIRYKLYEKSPLCSRIVTLRQHDKEASILEVKHSKRFLLPATTSLIWYLREESLEVQVWIKGKTRKDKDDGTVLPGHRDKLAGSAFIHLSSLVVPGLESSQISGEFPLFKAGADVMDGARIHVQVSLSKPNTHSQHLQMDEQEELNETLSSDEYPSTKGFVDNDSTSFKSSTDQQPNDGALLETTPPKSTPCTPDDSFAAHIIIQEAHHLTTVFDRNGDRVPPDVYVSYQVSPSSSTMTTPVVNTSTKPVWEFQKLEYLPLSTLKSQNLVFKVWHQSDHLKVQEPNNKHFSRKGDRPDSDGYNLGFASVDLSPLASGLRQLIGWYNITDFNGHCKGQIKVGVVPLAPVSPSRCLSRSRLHTGILPVTNTDKPFLSRFSDSPPSLLRHIAFPSKAELMAHSRAINADPGNNYHQEASIREQRDFPAATSSSFLFRQLRQNMQDLDHLQKDLQAKLSGMLAGEHNSQGHPYVQTQDKSTYGLGNPSTETIQLTAHSSESKATSTSSFLCRESTILLKEDFNGQTTNKVEQIDLIKEQENLDLDTQPSDDIQQLQLQVNMDLNSQTANNIQEAEIEEENLLSKDVFEEQENSGGIIESVIETVANIRDKKVISHEIGNFDNDNERDTGNDEQISDKYLSHDSDSLEEVSVFEKANSKSSLPYVQELDSWLSSGDEDKQKSPVTALAFTFPDNELNTNPHKLITCPENLDDSSTFLPGDVFKTDIDSEFEITEAMNLFNDKQKKKFVTDKNDYHVDTCMASDAELKTSESFDSHNSSHNNNGQEGFTNQHLKEQISNESKEKYSAIPNFFMHTQDLENSMRALRLGAKLGYPSKLTSTLTQSKLLERTFKRQENQDAEGIISQYSRREAVYKAKQDMQPPLSSNEIDRIAKIFSSKQK